ncbi:MAG: peroxiredoxin [Actinobacteria bacterium]|nr:peroxiredoxin [Actinomycetota bacterium]
MLNNGQHVEDFTLPDQEGKQRSLSEFLAKGPVVLFFYHAAMTPGCTKESCHFRDLGAEFTALGAQRIGISLDSVERQAEFSVKHNFDYPLLSDIAALVAKQFGVKRSIGFLKTRRATFVINTDSTIAAAFSSEMNMDAHADKALAVLKGLPS